MASTTLAITVDEKFARFGAKSYAISQITSVGIGETRKARWPWVPCALIAVPLAIGAIASEPGSQTGLMITAAIFGILAFTFWSRKPAYHLVLATAGGEVQPATSPDAAEIIALRDAIEAQIAKR